MKVVKHSKRAAFVFPFDGASTTIDASVQGLPAFGDVPEARVNWPGCGAVSPAQARIFAQGILEAADIAEKLAAQAQG